MNVGMQRNAGSVEGVMKRGSMVYDNTVINLMNVGMQRNVASVEEVMKRGSTALMVMIGGLCEFFLGIVFSNGFSNSFSNGF